MKENKKNKIYLDKNWKFSLNKIPKNLSNNYDIKIKFNKSYEATVPGTIHTDLLKNKIIDDPFYIDNEKKLDWIDQCDWIYQSEFNFSKELTKHYSLVFEGLDTIADIYLNGKQIRSINNMFLEYRIDVSKNLISGKNVLKIIFNSSLKYGEKQEKKYGKLPVERTTSRAYVRKAQYSFGWDWGPAFPTCGIWRNVYIEEIPKIKINDFTFHTKRISKRKAIVGIKIYFDKIPTSRYSINVELKDTKLTISKHISPTNKKDVYTEIEIQNPELWWPNGEGDQNFYLLNIKILDTANNVIDEINKKVGIRTIELLLKERDKNVFKFRINNRIVFAKGANWIPADSFLPRVSDSKYFNLLKSAKDASMNIIRVWGGGIYESNKFYEFCDELGLMIWQDFMFACASYPEHKEFILNVKSEVRQNVFRLQYHPSIIIWCGNNENEWIWYRQRYTSYKKMSGYKIYHSVIPSILKNIDPFRPYWPSSPFGYEKDPNSIESGNRHQWDIWSRWIDYDEVKYDASLFVTEFGFQAPANKITLEKCLPIHSRKIHDPIFEFHNKQIEGTERVFRFLAQHFPVSTKFDEFIYLAQLNQAFALATCLQHWRTNAKTFGSIIWQLNDCWPVTSWSIIDSESIPKLSYYFVKNIFSQQIIYFDKKTDKITIKIQNQSQFKFKGILEIKIIDSASGKILEKYSKEITVNKNSEVKIKEYISTKFDDQKIIYATLKNELNKRLNFAFYNKRPWKHYKFAKPKIKFTLSNKKDKKQIILTSNKPAYFIDLNAKGILFSKRGFSIMPNEKVVVDISGQNVNKIKLNDIKIYSLNTFLK